MKILLRRRRRHLERRRRRREKSDSSIEGEGDLGGGQQLSGVGKGEETGSLWGGGRGRRRGGVSTPRRSRI